MNTREKVLKEALNCVNGEREKQYGSPEDNFKRIAALWTDYINMSFKGFFEAHKIGGIILEPIDVAKMMVLFKIARSNGDKDKMDNYVDMIGYAACGAEILERSKEDSKKVKEWTEKMKGFGGNTGTKEAVNELKREGKKFAEKIFRPGLTPNYNLNNIELADECKDCDYAKKCMGTGVCLKEEVEKWFDCGAKKDKPDEKCSRKDCGQFDACMTAYQHYIYNKTKEASEAIDKCMFENKINYGSYLQSYNNISAYIVRESSKANVNPCDVVDNLTRKGNAPTEMAALLANGKLGFDDVASYVQDVINELKEGKKEETPKTVYKKLKMTEDDMGVYLTVKKESK